MKGSEDVGGDGRDGAGDGFRSGGDSRYYGACGRADRRTLDGLRSSGV